MAALSSLLVLWADEDIIIPLDDGTIAIRADLHVGNNQLTWRTLYPAGGKLYALSYRIVNQTGSYWETITLRFDVGAFCDGKPVQWSIPVTVTSLRLSRIEPALGGSRPVSSMSEIVRYGTESVFPLGRDVSDCTVELIDAALISATNGTGKTVLGSTTTPVLSTERIMAHRAQREADAAERAKKEAAEAEARLERQKRLEADRAKAKAEEERLAKIKAENDAKIKAEKDAKALEELRRIRAACTAVYRSTIDKKVTDLTVREAQQVQACRELGLYPPR